MKLTKQMKVATVTNELKLSSVHTCPNINNINSQVTSLQDPLLLAKSVNGDMQPIFGSVMLTFQLICWVVET